MRQLRLTTSEPESPATVTFLENLRPEFERAGLPVEPVRCRVDRPGKLPEGLATVALVLAGINLVADIVSAVYTVLQHAQTKRLAKPQPGPTAPSDPVPPRPPIVISVRLGSAGAQYRVASLDEAKALDVMMDSLRISPSRLSLPGSTADARARPTVCGLDRRLDPRGCQSA